MMSFKEYWLDDLKARMSRKTFRKKEYDHAIEVLHKLIQRKKNKRHDDLYYAVQIAKSYPHVDARELHDYYQELMGKKEK